MSVEHKQKSLERMLYVIAFKFVFVCNHGIKVLLKLAITFEFMFIYSVR